ncbi:MAG: hypothetical protein ACI9TH_004711 [Kiritimatiellia bacterium]|jgi:hypothetical protein
MHDRNRLPHRKRLHPPSLLPELMARDYRASIGQNRGVYVPRGIVYFIGFILLCVIGMKILRQPTWLVQRLDSPDGSKTAVLKRVQYIQHYYKVQAREHKLWHTVFTTGGVTNMYTVDLRERIMWSDDSDKLYFTLQGKMAAGYDFEADRLMAPEALRRDAETYKDRIAR